MSGACGRSRVFQGGVALNLSLLDAAKRRVPNIPVLVNMVSKRVRQLILGERPLIKTDPWVDREDIALQEIAEGKLVVEIDMTKPGLQ